MATLTFMISFSRVLNAAKHATELGTHLLPVDLSYSTNLNLTMNNRQTFPSLFALRWDHAGLGLSFRIRSSCFVSDEESIKMGFFTRYSAFTSIHFHSMLFHDLEERSEINNHVNLGCCRRWWHYRCNQMFHTNLRFWLLSLSHVGNERHHLFHREECVYIGRGCRVILLRLLGYSGRLFLRPVAL